MIKHPLSSFGFFIILYILWSAFGGGFSMMGFMMMLLFGAASPHIIVLVATAVVELAIANQNFDLQKSMIFLIGFIISILTIFFLASPWYRSIFICCGGHFTTMTYAYILFFVAYCLKLGVSKSRNI
jgi:hypothetical protein